jgi:molybdate transport system substrate-binding protein
MTRMPTNSSWKKKTASRLLPAALLLAACLFGPAANAADLVVLSTGAYLPVLRALAPSYEAGGNHLAITNDTAGAVLAKVQSGAPFDVVVLTPGAIDELIRAGKLAAGSRADLAQVGVGVVVRKGAPHPAIATVDEFRASLLAAPSVAYIDPKSGGSSGIYVAGLLQRLGIADQVAAKAVLVQGGRVADHVADGEAVLGIHQISEILPVAGAELVGPLPDAIQSVTIYSAGISAGSSQHDAAAGLLKLLTGPQAAPVLAQKGMAPATR